MCQLLHSADVFADLCVRFDLYPCCWIETHHYKAALKQVVIDCGVLCS